MRDPGAPDGPDAPAANGVADDDAPAVGHDTRANDLSASDLPADQDWFADDDDAGALPETHRGAFGEFGGESGGLIERTFRERIVIVGMDHGAASGDVELSLDELELLVDTAGADVVSRVVQRRSSPDPATYIGKGKAAELAGLCDHLDVDTVVFDDELTPGQQFTLERILGRSAIDRTAVILDIFAQNASSLEGKVQVELAQLRYRLPRLRGRGLGLSQQAGGIGTRGPGETQLEVDRRRLQRRIHKLEADLQGIGRHRATQRKARHRSPLRNVAIVGYTNAGKSTLLNFLTDAGVLVEDRLFATLDATTRRLSLPGGESVLLTDTVGFITKLPHGLVEAFRSTLDVVAEADLLVHVVDGSSPDPDANIAAVHEVLGEIGVGDVPEVLVFNKVDLDPLAVARVAADHPGALAVSARTGTGIDALLHTVAERLRAATEEVDLVVPWARGEVLAALHRHGEVLAEDAVADGMRIRVRLEPGLVARFAEFAA
jgi:GTPase